MEAAGGRKRPRTSEVLEGLRGRRIFQKQPQQYFCSHMFLQNLLTPHQQVAPISSLLELK